ncbi:NUDIX hydrolase [Paeniroseomonas aquatica]|uniref:NUDIX domain-containing protein n=1 Tax=Paeniroseomonas aquatica TaxID=373043 RepID=A0ABT8A6P9_9PROT|nr:NUDIX domain-containing protein [Paeniroseomonas aquatica]MDN3565399.1 NUDIX domain-containing protein [Paeniroseomonas aquatica]
MTGREFPDRPWVGIGMIVFDGERVLLARRGKAPRIGSWSLPGGAQHLGERAEAAARRELLEETGIEVGPLELAAVVDAITTDVAGGVLYHYTIVDYCARWASGEARPGDDVAAVAWVLPEELPSYDLTPDVLRVIAEARRRL